MLRFKQVRLDPSLARRITKKEAINMNGGYVILKCIFNESLPDYNKFELSLLSPCEIKEESLLFTEASRYYYESVIGAIRYSSSNKILIFRNQYDAIEIKEKLKNIFKRTRYKFICDKIYGPQIKQHIDCRTNKIYAI